MKFSFINDWRYLFSKDAIGGQFASFTFILITFLRTGMDDIDVDGFTFVLFGLGFRMRRRLRNS